MNQNWNWLEPNNGIQTSFRFLVCDLFNFQFIWFYSGSRPNNIPTFDNFGMVKTRKTFLKCEIPTPPIFPKYDIDTET